jgi:hypothetical protein
MSDFSTAIATALMLIASNDAELREIVFLSLEVSLTAGICAMAISAPLGTALAVYRFRGRGALIVIANALLGLPPVEANIGDAGISAQPGICYRTYDSRAFSGEVDLMELVGGVPMGCESLQRTFDLSSV